MREQTVPGARPSGPQNQNKGGNTHGGGNKFDGPRVNHQIRVPEVRLIGDDGHQYGVVSINEARDIADKLSLDLVEVSPTAKPPVVKVIDFGKYKYELQKKAAEARKKQVVIQLKEIQFRPNIEAHDLQTKVRRAVGFLEDGDKVKLVMQFRGREMAYKEQGMEKFMNIVKSLGELAVLEAEPKFMGNRIISIVAPAKLAVPVKK